MSNKNPKNKIKTKMSTKYFRIFIKYYYNNRHGRAR